MESEVANSVGTVLKFLRQLNCYKAKDFSKEIGISATYLSEIENSKKTPSLDILAKCGKVLNIKVSAILLLAEKMPNKDNYQETVSILLQGMTPH